LKVALAKVALKDGQALTELTMRRTGDYGKKHRVDDGSNR